MEKDDAIFKDIHSLGFTGTILHIGAHPDDEDSGLLAYLSMKYGARVLYWSATRGEKGQNSINQYRNEDLGIIRTFESQDESAMIYTECLFGPVVDFGFCKSATHAITQWNNLQNETQIDWRNEILTKSIVAVIRRYKPIIVIGRWTGTSKDGHGHHQAVGLATKHAFELAGDVTAYPELLTIGLNPWEPLKLYLSQNNAKGKAEYGGFLNLVGDINDELEVKPNTFKINTGEFELLSNATYQERAWKAYAKHRSQAMVIIPKPNPFFYYYTLEKSNCLSDSAFFFDGIETTFQGFFKSLANVHSNEMHSFLTALEALQDIFIKTREIYSHENRIKTFNHAIKCLENLEVIENHFNLLPNNAFLDQQFLAELISYKRGILNNIVVKLSNIRVDFLCDSHYVSDYCTFNTTLLLWNSHNLDITDIQFDFNFPKDWLLKETPAHSNLSTASMETIRELVLRMDHEITTPTVQYSFPSWLKELPRNYKYKITDKELAHNGGTTAPLWVRCTFKLGNHFFNMTQALNFQDSDRRYCREIPVHIVPKLSIHPVHSIFYIASKNQSKPLTVMIDCYSFLPMPSGQEGEVKLRASSAFKIEPPIIKLHFEHPFEKKRIQFNLTILGSMPSHKEDISILFSSGDKVYENKVISVYQGPEGMSLPSEPNYFNSVKEAHYFYKSDISFIGLDLNFYNNIRYGYIEGSKTDCFSILHELGFDIETINPDKLTHLDLSQFDTIIIGEHAYFLNPALSKHNNIFLEFVNNGGTLIVHMQRNFYADNNLAPYPITYSTPHDRVTNNKALVTFLVPDHIILNTPNKISQSDFDFWEVDRGLYFWKTWSNYYQSITSCCDPGESELEGGLLSCHYGRGNYVYIGYTVCQQITKGVVGALRLYANVLSIAETEISRRIDILKQVTIFSELTDQELIEISKIPSVELFEENQVIIQEGSKGNTMYLIEAGDVEILKQNKSITVLKRNNIFGELAIFSDIERTATAIAKTKVECLVFHAEKMIEIILKHPIIGINIIRTLITKYV